MAVRFSAEQETGRKNKGCDNGASQHAGHARFRVDNGGGSFRFRGVCPVISGKGVVRHNGGGLLYGFQVPVEGGRFRQPGFFRPGDAGVGQLDEVVHLAIKDVDPGDAGAAEALFEAQIKKGGPVTLTDPNIVRYFMTIPEAAQLVLQAGALAESGNIYVLDRGEPVRIMDLAKQLIRFYGYEPGVNMEIKIVGLRPGEKLYEELMMDEEQGKMRRTEHNKIFVASPRDIDLAVFYQQLQDLAAAAQHNDEGVVDQLEKMIPTFTPTRKNLKV